MINHSLTLTASHIIRLYMWEKLRAYMPDTWEPIKDAAGRDIPPIVPVQQQPEVQASENPYMVYVYDTDASAELWMIQGETLSLRIFSQSPATLSATTKLLVRLFGRWDDSAREVNDWIATYPSSGMWADDIKNYRFTTIRIAGVEGAQPATESGGRADTIVSISLEFIEDDPWELDPDLGLENNNPT